MLMEDNQGTIAIVQNPIAHARTKHIDIHYHYICEAVQDRTTDLHYCPTSVMIADLLMEPLSKGLFQLPYSRKFWWVQTFVEMLPGPPEEVFIFVGCVRPKFRPYPIFRRTYTTS